MGSISLVERRAVRPRRDSPDPRRIRLLEDIQFENPVADIRTRGRHLVFGEDVAPGHLDKPAPRPEAGEARVDEPLARQAVEDQVHALAARRFQDLPAEVGRAAVEHVLDAERAQKRLLGSAGRGIYLRPRRLSQLDGREADSASAGVNQHAFASFQPRVPVGECSRDERAGDGGEVRDRHSLGSRRHQFLAGDHFRAEGAKAQSNHVVADVDGRDL